MACGTIIDVNYSDPTQTESAKGEKEKEGEGERTVSAATPSFPSFLSEYFGSQFKTGT